MKTRLAAALAALLAAGMVAVAAPAQATNHIHASATQAEPVCATWKMRGGSVVDGQFTWGGAPEGSSVSASSATLVKPEGESPGVEFAAFDLNVTAPEGNELLVGVDYATEDGATTAAGAIRLFGYKVKNADTVNDGPTYGPAVAASESGHLVLTIPAGEKLGTLGVVYDASNSSSGSVTFSDMTIGTSSVQFTACPEPEPTVTPTATPTATPSTPNVTPTATAPVPTDSAAPVPTLPVTGTSSLGWLALAGASALGSGALLYALARRRRVSFRA